MSDSMIFSLKDGGEQLNFFDKLLLDDSVVLDGSCATYGARRGDFQLEVFEQGYDKSTGLTWLEVYPLDGRDSPVEVGIVRYEFSDFCLRSVIQAALVHRSFDSYPTTR